MALPATSKTLKKSKIQFQKTHTIKWNIQQTTWIKTAQMNKTYLLYVVRIDSFRFFGGHCDVETRTHVYRSILAYNGKKV